jgi:hypothetical protein
MATQQLNIVYPSANLREKIRQERSSSSPVAPSVHFDSTATQADQQKKKLRKKKKKWKGDRDSLNTRYKKPKVGTRKYQRWLNEVHLNHDWTDLTEIKEEIDLFELNEELLSRPNFSFIPEDKAAEELFDFWYGDLPPPDLLWGEKNDDVTIEKSPDNDQEAPLGRFWKIPRLARRCVAQSCHSLFLQELEEDLSSYLLWLSKNEEEGEEVERSFGVDGGEGEFICNSITYECVLKAGELEFLFPDPLTRFIAHSVCRYYGLSSQSWGPEGNRKTTVSLSPNNAPTTPSSSLKNFILSSYFTS